MWTDLLQYLDLAAILHNRLKGGSMQIIKGPGSPTLIFKVMVACSDCLRMWFHAIVL